ncbi:MAG: 16S rRNA (cytosine(1402)-N(4))-methyltransferase, partial [Pseudolabrys sp.]
MTAHLFPAPASKPVSPEVCVDAGFPDSGAGGGAHIPVLGGRIVEFLNVRAGGIYIDGTFGAGGYTEEILDAADCRVIAIDRDPTVHERAGSLADRFAGRLTLVEDRFSHLDVVATGRGVPAVDGVVLDVGVSSMQLDEAERGFSFRHDGPLDMR